MNKKNKKNPTQAELEILQILWKKHPETVRYVYEELNKIKEIGYTTALKLMQIMIEKKLLIRYGKGRQHTYSPAIEQEQMQHSLLDKFLNSAFGGSASKLVMQTLGNYKPSREELKKIKDLIKSLEGE